MYCEWWKQENKSSLSTNMDKSLGTLLHLWSFFNSNIPNPSPTPQTTLDTSIKNVFWVSTLCKEGEGRNATKTRKVNWFKIRWSSLLLRDKQFSWNYVGHRRYLATIPNHERNLWRMRNHLKKVKENNSKKMKYFLTIKILWHRPWCLN